MSIDEILDLLSEKEDTSTKEMVFKTGMDDNELLSILREAEIEGVVYRFKKGGEERWSA